MSGNPIRIACFCLLLASAFSRGSPAASGSFNSIRIVNIPGIYVTDSLLDRIVRSKYNYAVVSFDFRVSDDSVGNGDIYANIRADVCSLCIRLDRHNLRMIPIIPMSSKWALQWKFLQVFENPAIGVNTIAYNDDLPVLIGKNKICQYSGDPGSAAMGCNSWASEPDGVDKSMLDIFRAVRDGYSDAKPQHPLEYIHIQHDEPQFLNWLLMAGAGADCGNASPYRGNFARTEVSASDIAYITALLQNGVSTEEAYQRLLADELYRRVSQAEEVFGPDVKLLFYAESFDNQSWGGVPWRVNLDGEARILMHNVITLPGLSDEQKDKVKKRTVPVLWNYDGKAALVTSLLDWLDRSDYDSDLAFQRFAAFGYNFLYTGALQNGDASVQQINEYAAASKKYPENCRGYCAAAWDAPYVDSAPDPKWDIIEYMASLQDNTTGSLISGHRNTSTLLSAATVSTSPSGLSATILLVNPEHVAITFMTPGGRHTETLINRQLNAGTHVFRRNPVPGLYLVRIRIGSTVMLKRVTVVR